MYTVVVSLICLVMVKALREAHRALGFASRTAWLNVETLLSSVILSDYTSHASSSQMY